VTGLAPAPARESLQLESKRTTTGPPVEGRTPANQGEAAGGEPNSGADLSPQRDLEAETAVRTARAHAQRAAKAAEDAAETARQRAEDPLPPPGAPIRMITIEAARDAARAAADAAWRASQEAAQAETAAQMVIGGGSQARQAAVTASARTEDAALQALEAAEEGKDRPRWIAPAMAVPPPEVTGFFGGWRRAARSQSAFVEGQARYSAEDYRGARERFSEAVMLDPDHDEARALLGWAEYFDGDYSAAAITFKTLVRRQPAWEGLYDGLGWSRLRAGRPRLAREAFRAALAIEPEYLDALIGLGSAEFELRRYAEALPSLTIALRRLRPLVGEDPPQASRVQAKVGWSLYHLDRHQEALVAFEAGVRAGRDVHLFHAGMGWCFLRLQRVAEARTAFERALTLEPGYRDALDGLRLTSR
jgi:tetratricopeptide (TPR) repeat protein